MSLKMLIFDYKNSEKEFFKRNKFEDFDISFYETSLNEFTVKNLSETEKNSAVIISVFITSDINENVLKHFKNLKILTTRSTGYDHININACRTHKIKVFNVENYSTFSIVQYTFGLILALVRKIFIANKDLRTFKYEYNKYLGRELNKLTLGVIGIGYTSSNMFKIANSFGMNILAYDLTKNNKNFKNKYNVKYIDKDSLLAQSDIITLHLPINKNTRNMLSKREFSLMKPNALIINTSGGELIETEALYDALINKTIAGAALDDVECEEITFDIGDISQRLEFAKKECISKAVLTRRLTQMDNVIITPHLAYETQDLIDRILEITFTSIKNCIKGKHTNYIN